MPVEQSTEQIIKEAAKKVFVRKGFAGARMQDIADEAGMNKALLHYYYRNKETLFEVIFNEVFDRMMPQFRSVLEGNKDILSKIKEFVEAYISTIRENPHIPLFILHELNQDPDRFINKIRSKPGLPDISVLLRQISEEMDNGRLRRVNPFHLLISILSMCAFPFIARPMIKAVTGMDDPTWDQLMEERTREVQQFIHSALAP